METNKSKKPRIILYTLLLLVGLVIACSNFIPNDYVKFGVAIVPLCIGFFGFFATVGQSNNPNELNEK